MEGKGMEKMTGIMKVLSLLQKEAGNIRKVSVSTDDDVGDSNKIYFDVNFTAPVNTKIFNNVEGELYVAAKGNYFCYAINLDNFSSFSKETYPVFCFINQNFEQFTFFERYSKFYSDEHKEYVQGSGFRLTYYSKESLKTDAYWIPCKRQNCKDNHSNELVQRILYILSSRMKYVKYAQLILFENGQCRFIIQMESNAPKRLKPFEGLKFVFKPNDNLFAIDFNLEDRYVFSKILWYFYSKEYVMRTDLVENYGCPEQALLFRFIKIVKTD